MNQEITTENLLEQGPVIEAELFPDEASFLKLKNFGTAEPYARVKLLVDTDYDRALNAEDPTPESVTDFIFAPSPVTEEKGEREPKGKKKTVMVDSALFAVREIMSKHPESLLYGQDVGGRLGGVFREAATLAQQFGDERVFNTPIQEAFIIGSTVGMSAVGLKPIVEVQFADYIWPGLNQLFTEVSRSYYLSNGKWPVSCIIRVPIGAYGSGGPYHSSSVESVLTNIRGVKTVYPSTGADLKGLMKAAFYDPNPVVILEHKGLYWSKIKGTEGAMSIEPDEDYIIPIGKGRIVQHADESAVKKGESCAVITYGRGVYWTLEACASFKEKVEIVDLRTLHPLDFDLINEVAKKHGKVLLVTEESVEASFTLGLAGRIQRDNFKSLDAPVAIVGSVDTPAIPLNSTLEATLLPNAEKVKTALDKTQQLCLELDMDDPNMQVEMMNSMMMQNGVTMKSLAKPEDFKAVDAFLTANVGFSAEMLNTVKPFMVSAMLYPKMLNCEMQSVEAELIKIAKTQNEEVIGLETVSEQLAVFDAIPYQEQMNELVITAKDNMQRDKTELTEMMAIYKSENVEAMVTFTEKSPNAMTSKYGDVLLKNRNQNWISRMTTIAKNKPTFFGVGAAHLGGKEGVIALLRKAGFTVEAVY